jgi:uncharacterized membrane protein
MYYLTCMKLELIIWWFFLYSIVGYIAEVLYCSVIEKRVVNRGFLQGPYLPIYGFGSLVVILFLVPWANSPIALFIFSTLATSLVEYLGSYLLELVLHVQLWNYRQRKFNIDGRIYPTNSLLFGLLSVVVVYGIHPFITRYLLYMPEQTLRYGSSIILIIISVDTTYSTFTFHAFQQELVQFKERIKELEKRLHLTFHLSPSQKRVELRKKVKTDIEELREKLFNSGKSILSRFPTITSKDEEKRRLLNQLRDKHHHRKKQTQTKKKNQRKKN